MQIKKISVDYCSTNKKVCQQLANLRRISSGCRDSSVSLFGTSNIFYYTILTESPYRMNLKVERDLRTYVWTIFFNCFFLKIWLRPTTYGIVWYCTIRSDLRLITYWSLRSAYVRIFVHFFQKWTKTQNEGNYIFLKSSHSPDNSLILHYQLSRIIDNWMHSDRFWNIKCIDSEFRKDSYYQLRFISITIMNF